MSPHLPEVLIARYTLAKNRKVAIIGVVSEIVNNGVMMSSLTQFRVEVTMETESLKLGSALLLLEPALVYKEGHLKLSLDKKEDLIVLGTAIDFGICTHEKVTLCAAKKCDLEAGWSEMQGKGEQGHWQHVSPPCKGE